MNYLNHRLPPFERNLKPTRFFALVNRELNEVFSFGVYKEKFVCGRAVFNESNGFQVRVRRLLSWVVLLWFRAYSEEDFRVVRLGPLALVRKLKTTVHLPNRNFSISTNLSLSMAFSLAF